jgi:hypothetical protein
MSEKLIAQMAVHLTDSEKESIQKLAVLRGISGSEYIREIMSDHLRDKRAPYMTMRGIFGDVLSSDSSDSAPVSE